MVVEEEVVALVGVVVVAPVGRERVGARRWEEVEVEIEIEEVKLEDGEFEVQAF